MEDQNKPESNIKSTIDAVTGLVQAIPVYQDVLQPAAKEVGKSLETVVKTVNIVLAPVKALVWGYEKIEGFVIKRVSEKLKNVSSENIVSPNIQVVGPAIEALRFLEDEVDLREMYANLIANAMDSSTTNQTHPGFVEVIKNISSQEAILLKAFVNRGGGFPIVDITEKLKTDDKTSVPVHRILGDLKAGHKFIYYNYSHFQRIVNLEDSTPIPSYIDNLCRLGILTIPEDGYLVDDNLYTPLENDPELDSIKKIVQSEGKMVDFVRKYIRLTSFGRSFVELAVKDKE